MTTTIAALPPRFLRTKESAEFLGLSPMGANAVPATDPAKAGVARAAGALVLDLVRRGLTPRQILIVLHDLVATAAAIVLTFYIRFEDKLLDVRLPGLKILLPIFLIYALAVYFIFGLHRNKWRFTSVPDLYNIFRATTVLAVSLLALDYVLVEGEQLVLHPCAPIWIDTDAFLQHLAAAEVLEQQSLHDAAMQQYQAAEQLYRADYLVDEGADPAIELRREQFKDRYLGVLVKLADYYQAYGESARIRLLRRRIASLAEV